MKWYVYLALKQLFPSNKRTTFLSAMSILGVAIGVCVLFVVSSVMNGFHDKIKRTIVETQGDVQISSHRIINNADDVYAVIDSFEEIEAASPFACGVVMMRYGNRPLFPVVKGIDMAKEAQVSSLMNFIKSGTIDDFGNDGMIISERMAHEIGVNIGDMVDIYSPTMFENAEDNEMPLPKTLTVVATYETGYHHIDKNVAILPIDVVQDMYRLNTGIHGISIKLSSGANAEKIAHELNRCLPPDTFAHSWQEINEDFLFAVKTEKVMMGFILAFIIIVSAFSIANSLMITVIRKTREIGLIGAFGGTRKQCAACFSIQGLIIGTIGSVIGILIGAIVIRFRNDIVDVFVKMCQINDFMSKFYSFSNMPAKYCASDIIFITSFAISVCLIASIIPAKNVAKINPAEALRNE